MVTEKSQFTIVIPNWENKVRIGYKTVKYYKAGDKLPKEYEGSKVKKVGKEYYYMDKANKKIIKNPGDYKKEEFWNLNGQSFYSTNMHWRLRSTIVNFYHAYFSGYIEAEWKEQFPTFLAYKLNMEMTIYDTYSRFTPDITNMWILPKMFEDAMVMSKILREDSPEFRMRTSYGYEFVDKEEDRKLVVTFSYGKY